MASIHAEGVGVTFGSEPARTVALRDASIDIAPGEFVSIVGESGCGKTTLLRCIAGLESPTSGRVRIGATVVDRPLPEIGLVFQRAVLLPWRNVMDNVLLPVEIDGGSIEAKRGEAIELLRVLGLADFAGHFPRQLSGGMQQRVSIARTLINAPSVLLMDEPFGALDAITREQMNVELLGLWTQRRPTCVFITHDIPEAVFLSDRVVLMSRRPGTVQRIFDIPLPRPRAADLRFTPELIDIAHEIRAAMQDGERRAA